jgi:hypothetical protein
MTLGQIVIKCSSVELSQEELPDAVVATKRFSMSAYYPVVTIAPPNFRIARFPVARNRTPAIQHVLSDLLVLQARDISVQ